MGFDGGLLTDTVTFELRVDFDASAAQGGRRSLLFNAGAAVDFTSRVSRVGRVEHATEVELHSFVTSDLDIEFKNERTSDGTIYGYFDSASLSTDLGPIENVLCRISMRVLDETSSWTPFTPLYTGLLTDIETGTNEGTAQAQVTGIPTVLVEEPADEVRDVDTWYQSLPIDRAIKLLLTQKDRWVPLYANNERGTVTAASSTSVSVSKNSGTWGNDLTGQKPNGVLEGYVVVMTSGPASGKVYTIKKNSGGGASIAVCSVAGHPSTDGVAAGHTCIVTGYCWPYLDTRPIGSTNELSVFTIDTVRRIPTHDGRRTLSVWGRPPEDGSTGVCRALAHDGYNLWKGVDDKLYRYDDVSGVDTQIAFTLPATYVWLRFFYDTGTSYVFGLAGRQQPDTTNHGIAGGFSIYKFDVTHVPVLVASDASGWNGNRLARMGIYGSNGTSTSFGAVNVGPGAQTAMVAPFPQTLLLTYNDSNPPSTVDVNFSDDPYSYTQTEEFTSSIPHAYPVSTGWSYPSLLVDDFSTGHDATWMVSSHVGGKYQAVYLNGVVYFWTFGGSSFKLRKLTCSTGALADVATFTFATWGCPAALWEDGTKLYAVFNSYGSRTTLETFKCYGVSITTGGTVTQLWNSDTLFPWTSCLFVDGGAGGGLNGVGCIMMYVPPGYTAPSPYHQKFLLVKDLHATTFWTNFKSGANVLAYSVSPWTDFYRHSVDDRAWFTHYGGNTLWHGFAGTAGPASEQPTVRGDRAQASQLCFTRETDWRVMGVSAGDLLDLKPDVGPAPGLYRLWQFAHWHTPRIDFAMFEGLSRWEALRQIAEASVTYIARYDEQGLFQFVQRDASGTPDHVLADDARFTQVRKRLLRSETFNQVVGTPVVGTLATPSVKWTPATLDDDGKPIDGTEFNGAIQVRQSDTGTKRVVLVCVVGNRATWGTLNSPLSVTETYWKVYNPAASPQWYQNALAIKYPGGWWEPGGHKVWIRLSDNENESDRIGFQVGDTIEISCAGIVASSNAVERVVAQSGDRVLEFKLRTHEIRNQLVGPDRMKDLCELELDYFSTPMRQLELEGRLYPNFKPLQSMQISVARLNVTSLVGFIRGATHDPHGSKKTTVTLREWPTISDPLIATLPDPVLPPQEPPESGQNGSLDLALQWQYQLPDVCYSTVAIDDIDNDGNQELVFLCWDNSVRCLSASGVPKWIYNPHTGSSTDNAYGFVCLADVNADGKRDVIWGSHDGYVRCVSHDGATLRWSLANYYTRTATPLPFGGNDTISRFFQHGGTWAIRTIASTPTLCIFQAGFDGRLLCIRATNGTILWTANLNFGNPNWTGSGEHPSRIEMQPSIADIDGDGQPEIFIGASQYALRFEDTGPVAFPGTPPDTPTWWFYADYNISSMAVAQIVGDGQYQILLTGGTWVTDHAEYRLYLLDRNGTLLSFFNLGAACDTKPTVHDIDRDGRKEILLATDAGDVFCLRTQGAVLTQVWKKHVTDTAINSSPCLLDVDGDGYREVLVAGYDGRFYVLDGRNGNIKQIVSLPAGGGVEGTITGGDIDGDGLVEVLVPNLEAGRIVCYRGSATFASNWFRGYGANQQRTGEIFGQ